MPLAPISAASYPPAKEPVPDHLSPILTLPGLPNWYRVVLARSLALSSAMHPTPSLRPVPLLLLLVTPLPAQDRPPQRPRLAQGADTNDASVYFALGVRELQGNPGRASQAFYWAERLDPASPVVPYARATAILLRDRFRLARYLEDDPRHRNNRDLRAVDSLLDIARMRDPFMQRGLESLVMVAYIRQLIREAARPMDDISDAQIAANLNPWLRDSDKYAHGLLAYSQGWWETAAQAWGEALREPGARRVPYLLAERARAFYMASRYDSARAQMQAALALLPASGGAVDGTFRTRALWLYSLGRIFEAQRADSAARQAYQDAVVENAAYYPAHFRLGMLALQRRDTPEALREFSAAATTHEDDYFARANLGLMYQMAGRHTDALLHLGRATELEPWAAKTWYALGMSLDVLGRRAEAIDAYTRYLSLAMRADNYREPAERRLATLRAAGP